MHISHRQPVRLPSDVTTRSPRHQSDVIQVLHDIGSTSRDNESHSFTVNTKLIELYYKTMNFQNYNL